MGISLSITVKSFSQIYLYLFALKMMDTPLHFYVRNTRIWACVCVRAHVRVRVGVGVGVRVRVSVSNMTYPSYESDTKCVSSIPLKVTPIPCDGNFKMLLWEI